MIVQQLIQEKVNTLLTSKYPDISSDIPVVVEHPSNKSWGDYAINTAFSLSKALKQSPVEIANAMCYELLEDTQFAAMFARIYVANNGFVNFVLQPEWLKSVPILILEESHSYGSSEVGNKSRVLIEYSQPNPNKPMHIGHARNNFLGNSIARIYSFLGYEVITANYMNDWGTHICKSMLMYKKHYDGKEPTKKPDHFVGDLYIKFEQDAVKDPSLADEVQELFRKLEAGDSETLQLWKKITTWVYEGWEKTYTDQGISFDVWFHQSNYKDSGKEVIEQALQQGIAEVDATGAVIARLEKFDLPDKVLLRSDGTSVYATQDIQLAKDGYDKYNYDRRIYVVDYRQGDYFKQIFRIASILGYSWADRLYHLAYGTVELPEGKMSSRKGLVINADDIFERLTDIELSLVSENLRNELSVVQDIAMGAFKYALLKYDTPTEITFDYAQVSSFTGNTGPYIQYTHARASSVLEKAGFDLAGFNFEHAKYLSKSLELLAVEFDLVRCLNMFPEVVIRAGHEYAPNHLCKYLFDLSQVFNHFYTEVPILNTPEHDLRLYRLALASATKIVIRNGLGLLGIQAPEKM